MKKLLINIKELLQVRGMETEKVSGADMKVLPSIENAYLLIQDDLIKDYGRMDQLSENEADLVIDLKGKTVLPAWCDSHTHIVYAGNREKEFVDRINGLSYEEIAKKGGGILNSAQNLRKLNEEVLYEQSASRLEEVMRQGTGAIEIKSGYGLSTASEIKMLRVIGKLAENYPVSVRATFLGAHAFPAEYSENKEAYVDLICEEMIPEVSANNLAHFIDVFCETGYFNPLQTERIMMKGREYGLVPKIHVNQFNSIGGIQAAINYRALTVDHLEVMEEKDFKDLAESDVMPVALPSCSYFLSIPYTPARRIIDMGMPLALASDYNPGSTPSGNMNFVVATACIKMRMTPEEAINAATINGAYAMGLQKSLGSITRGKLANLIVTKSIPSYAYLPYAFGSNHVEKVMIRGNLV